MLTSALTASAFGDFTQDVFMKLFVTQLQNQNPMEPMDNYEFTSQLAQMGELEQIGKMTSLFEQTLRLQEFSHASRLIGAQVTYMPADGETSRSGVVTAVKVDDGEVKLVVGDDLVPLGSVTEITAPAPQTSQDQSPAL